MEIVRIVILASAIAAGGIINQAQAENLLEPQSLTTDKGLNYWLIEDHSRPVISIKFSFLGGSWSETSKKAGTAYFLSSMLTEGAGKWNTEEFKTLLDENAISLGFQAQGRALSASTTFLKRKMEIAVEAIKASLTSPLFDDRSIERVRSEMIAQARSVDYVPNLKARHEWFNWQFKGTPMGRSSMGTVESINNLNKQDLKNYLANVTALSNLLVSVVGDVTPEEANKLIASIFHHLPSKPKIKNPDFAIVLSEAGKVKTIEQKSPQDKMVFGLSLPGSESDDYYPLLLLSKYIGSVPNGLLFREVREKMGLAYSVSGYASFWDKYGLFFGSADVSKGTWSKARDAMKKIFDDIEKGNIDKALMDRIQQHTIKSWVTRFVSSSSIAASIQSSQTIGLSIKEHQEVLEKIRQVTYEDLQKVAAKYFSFSKLGLLVLVPKDNKDSKN